MQHIASTLNIQDMIRFSQLMLRLQDVLRNIDLPRGVLRENDVEHSYHLAMMAWYLNSAHNLGYDTDRLLRYALVHDLAEAYAGDVDALDIEGRRGKEEREAAALDRISHDLPQTAELIDTIKTYDARIDAEAKFIYALDKLMPILMIYIDHGTTWHRQGLTMEELHANKVDKVAVSEPINVLYGQLKELLDQQPHLFSAQN